MLAIQWFFIVPAIALALGFAIEEACRVLKKRWK